MRTKICFFLMFIGVAASAQVTNVEPVSADYTNKTVSFRVWWNAGSRDATHLSKVWVWVDYTTVNSNNTTSGNTWTRATVGTISGGVTSYDGSNRQGFWLEGNTSTNYSATLTVQLTNVPAKFNWCAYGSDFPPNVTASGGTYTLHGTPPFTLIAANGTATQTVAATTIATSAVTVTPVTLTDQTGCPGVFCIYSGSDLYIDATHLCQQRTTGAKNWEAYITDAVDGQIYRITQFSDNSWWFADNFKRNTNVAATCSGYYYYAISNYPAGNAGWNLPTLAECAARWPGACVCDDYGGAIEGAGVVAPGYAMCSTPNGLRQDLLVSDCGTTAGCKNVSASGWGCNGANNTKARIRFRRLL